MAIAKVGSTGSSAGAIDYVLSENKEATKQPEILAGSFGTMAEIKQEFEIYNKLNTRVKNQATSYFGFIRFGRKSKNGKEDRICRKIARKTRFQKCSLSGRRASRQGI